MKTALKLACLPLLALGLAALYVVLRVDAAEGGEEKARKAGAV